MAGADQAHWEHIYSERDPHEVSWYEPEPASSLRLIEGAGLDRDAPILDAGGGASALAARLVELGHTDITVADISAAALSYAREELGRAADRITWVEADLRDHDFGRRFALWHDRAVFHFMLSPDDRAAYMQTLRQSLAADGHVVIACFSPDGPPRCSGLPVARYDADGLAAELGAGFELSDAQVHTHHTPGGSEQEFTLARFSRAEGGEPAP